LVLYISAPVGDAEIGIEPAGAAVEPAAGVLLAAGVLVPLPAAGVLVAFVPAAAAALEFPGRTA
jgi:hypothetical protein